MQVQIGYVLQDISTKEYELFYAGQNTALFDTAILVRSQTKVDKVIDRIKEINWDEQFLMPKSEGIFYCIIFSSVFCIRKSCFLKKKHTIKYSLLRLTLVSLAYARVLVYHDNRPISSCSTESLDIPSYLKKSRHVLTYKQQSEKDRKKCNNLCVFEAITEHLYRYKTIKYGKNHNRFQFYLSRYFRGNDQEN